MVKTAMITGASRGMGRQIALSLAKLGWKTALFARNVSELNTLSQEILGLGSESLVIEGSVEDYSQVEKAFSVVDEKWGRLDLLVNNAGVGLFASLEDLRPEDWERVVNPNARGTFFTLKAGLRLLSKTPHSLVINVESDVARRGFDGGNLYCASKFAQEGLTQAVRKEFRKHGIRVCAIYPGLTDTGFGDTQPGASHKQEWLQPEDVARAVTFIAQSPSHVVIDELVIHPFCQDY